MKTHYNFKRNDPVERPTLSIVETAGYIDTEERINAMLRAGQQLEDYRKALYHFGSDKEIIDDYVDPTVNPAYDVVDAQGDSERIKELVKSKKEAYDEALAEQNKQAVEKAQVEENKPPE